MIPGPNLSLLQASQALTSLLRDNTNDDIEGDHMGGKAGKKKATPAAKKNAAPAPRSGVPFELRATRAASQMWPDVAIKHDEKLPTEYGIARQFDVTGRSDNILTRTYEARDHKRNVSINQVEGFAKKLDKLIEKPQTAGIISSKNFSKPAKKWVEYYRSSELVRELYTLKTSAPGDFNDSSDVSLESEIRSLRLKTARTHSHEDRAGESVAHSFTSERRTGFLYSDRGEILGNLLDIVNAAMRDALRTNILGPTMIKLPSGSHISTEDKRLPAATLEVEFEEFSIPSTTVVDLRGRFPDVLEDALSGQKWLIEDRERALKASRTGLDLKLAFPDDGDSSFVDLHKLTVEPPSIEFEQNLRQTAASLSLTVALAYLDRSGREDVPQSLKELLTDANENFATGAAAKATELYLESLKHGTSLDALCNLAYLAFEAGDYEKAAGYSALAARTFPLQPHGFTNLAAALIAANRHAEARGVLSNSRILHGPSLLFRKQEAELLFAEGRIQDSAHMFYSVVLDDPSDARALANLAKCEASLGEIAHAAWDASRAFDGAPHDVGIAEFAAKTCYQARQHDAVLDIVERAKNAGLKTTPLSRFALNAAIERTNYTVALDWLHRLPKKEWTQEEWVLSGKLLNLLGDYEQAIAAFRDATERAPLDCLDRLWMAESLLRTQQWEEVLAALDGVANDDAKPLRAQAFALLGRTSEMIRTLEEMDHDLANTACIHCLDRVVSTSHRATLTAGTNWLLARESTDREVLTRQTSALAALAFETRNAADVERAMARLSQSRNAAAEEGELVPSEILLAMANGREDLARAAIPRIDPRTRPDMLAMLASAAFRREMLELASTLADIALASEQQPVHFQLETVVLERVLVAFRLGQSRESLKSVLARSPLPSDMWGRLAGAVVHYLDGELLKAIEILRPQLSEKVVPVQSIHLLSQCLAEDRQYQALQDLCAREFPSLAALATWAAARRPTREITAAERGMAAVASFMHPREFLGIPETGHYVPVSPGVDWANALSGVKASAPNATAVWVARVAEPTDFIRTLFNLKAPA